MNIERVGNQNATIVTFGTKLQLLFSYSTPVAGWVGDTWFKADRFYSATTSRHVNQYLAGANAKEVSPEWIYKLVHSVTFNHDLLSL